MLRLKIENIIKSHGLSLTKSRKRVLRFFLTSLSPLSLKQIRLLVGDIDRVTLFRVLSVFETKKIIHRIRLEDGQNLFALCKEQCAEDKHVHNHIHFQCERCDDVSCLPINDFPTLKVANYIFNNVNINVSGFYNNCS